MKRIGNALQLVFIVSADLPACLPGYLVVQRIRLCLLDDVARQHQMVKLFRNPDGMEKYSKIYGQS
jgi:hypothetical protein